MSISSYHRWYLDEGAKKMINRTCEGGVYGRTGTKSK
jgi:hypothetical protein